MSRKGYLVHKPVAPDKVLRSAALPQAVINALYIVQPKYDGVSLIVDVRALAPEAVKVFTRTGEPVVSCEHIVDCLLKFPGIVPGVYFGEAWIPGTAQAAINGFVMRGCASPDVRFVVFDYLTGEEFDAGHSPLGYTERVNRIPEPFFRINTGTAEEPKYPPVFPAVCEGVLDDYGCTAQEAANHYVSLGGYDGIILRNPAGTWTMGGGSGGEILKVKPGISLDLRVIGYELGKGKHEGRIGTLFVSLNGKKQGAGTGLKDSERDPANFERDFLGKIVQIDAMGYTEDGQLREPRFKGVRTDKLEADA